MASKHPEGHSTRVSKNQRLGELAGLTVKVLNGRTWNLTHFSKAAGEHHSFLRKTSPLPDVSFRETLKYSQGTRRAGTALRV